MSAQVSYKEVKLDPVEVARINEAVKMRGHFVATIFNDSPIPVEIQMDGKLDDGNGHTKSDSTRRVVASKETATMDLFLWMTAYYSSTGQARLTGDLQIYDRNNWQTIAYHSAHIEFEIA